MENALTRANNGENAYFFFAGRFKIIELVFFFFWFWPVFEWRKTWCDMILSLLARVESNKTIRLLNSPPTKSNGFLLFLDKVKI